MFGRKSESQSTDVALDHGPMGAAAQNLSEKLLGIGIDGQPPFDSADTVAAHALKACHGNVEQAIDKVVRDHRRMATASGFVTGLGGFVTMAVAIPANVAGFYLIATRMVAAIAKLRGHDLRNPGLRTAILLTLVGVEATAVLRKAGVGATGRLASLATRQLPPPVIMVINKAVGFRLVAQLGSKTVTKLGKLVPVAGGVIGAGLDGYLISKIGANARAQFPPVVLSRVQPDVGR